MLTAINSVLASTGMFSLSAADNKHPAYTEAETKINEVLTTTLLLGYWFNTVYVTLTPNAQGEVLLPSNTLQVDPVSRKYKYVQRGARMYNLDTLDYNIPKAVKYKLVQKLTYDELPQVVKDYVRIKAKYQYYMDKEGMEPKLSNYRADANAAWTAMYQENLKAADNNYFDSPTKMGRYLRRGSSGASYNPTPLGAGMRPD